MSATAKIPAAGETVTVNCIKGKPKGAIANRDAKKKTFTVSVKIDDKTKMLEVDQNDILYSETTGWTVINYGKEFDVPNVIQKTVDHSMNAIDKMNEEIPEDKPLIEKYMSYIKNIIDEKGIFPIPFFMESIEAGEKKKKLTVASLAISANEIFLAVKKFMKNEDPIELLFGLDRDNAEGQGIDIKFDSVFTIYHYTKKDGWKTSVLPYTNKGVIGKLSFDNAYWTPILNKDLIKNDLIKATASTVPIGFAYGDKITITEYNENKAGYFYEGTINMDKLSEPVQKFVKDNSLDLNKHKDVIDFFRKKGHTFKFITEPSDFGFISLEVDGTLLASRRSRTKLYLEAVEMLIETSK